MNASRPIEAVLLDLDGTLLDTAPDLIGSLNELRLEHNLEVLGAGELQPAVSHGSAPMIRRGFHLDASARDFEPLRQRFLALYRNRLARDTRPYPGMEQMLAKLEQRGIPWGIVTNKPGWLARPLLEVLGYDRRAACIVTGDCVARRKPDPYPILEACRQVGVDPAAVLVLGDAQRDVEAARRAGALALAALFGYIGAEDRVAYWGAHGLLGSPLELLRWLPQPDLPDLGQPAMA